MSIPVDTSTELGPWDIEVRACVFINASIGARLQLERIHCSAASRRLSSEFLNHVATKLYSLGATPVPTVDAGAAWCAQVVRQLLPGDKRFCRQIAKAAMYEYVRMVMLSLGLCKASDSVVAAAKELFAGI